ncbi:MAG TPA: cytidylate kinase-like family protein [Thermoanaerobaculaceae bacterium]|nr:cytidylate kinase-like family protein [Thermoanaerobaculaceae bacterium]
MREKPTVVLTISRQLGSGGSFIGQAVASRFGMRYADREILKQAAETVGLREGDLVVSEEKAATFWESLLHSFSLGAPDAAFVPPALPPVYSADLFKLESLIIREIADRFDTVIVGRAGFHVLAGRSNLANVMVHAASEFRVRRVMELYGIESEREAERLVERSDRQRTQFIKSYTGKDRNDARLFDLCVDTSTVGLETATELVAALVESMLGRRWHGAHTPVG